MIKKISSFFLLVSVLFSCSSDVDIIGPYDSTTVVYGLLNAGDDIHYVKINKTFLGEEDALIMAQHQDSSEYSNIDARIEKWVNGIQQDYHRTLRDTIVEDKEPGIFYYPEQTIYYFIDDDLEPEAEYRIVIEIEGKEEVVSGSTLIIQPTMSVPPTLSGGLSASTANQGLSFVRTYDPGNVEYIDSYNISLTTIPVGKRYSARFATNYTEVRLNGDSIQKQVNWTLDTRTSSGTDGGESLDITTSGENFYINLQSNISPNSDVDRRIFRGVDFTIFIGGEELYTYSLVNEPVTGIVEERPDYTNITNGIGVFSSRSIVTIEGNELNLNLNSMKELCLGQYTGSLKFCSDNPQYQFEQFYCPD